MMKIREATEEDIPDILEVLKASLGETSSKKTEDVWKYKHIDNPFGKSMVLVAIEENKIIGVRAFMRWKWQKGDCVFSAFRAVDTATHPKHQGKGIFKKDRR
jgi:predicted N-acetyltransferase YhbS